MFMGSIYLSCPSCDRKIRHFAQDILSHPIRICPGCGTKIEVQKPSTISGSAKPGQGH